MTFKKIGGKGWCLGKAGAEETGGGGAHNTDRKQ